MLRAPSVCLVLLSLLAGLGCGPSASSQEDPVAPEAEAPPAISADVTSDPTLAPTPEPGAVGVSPDGAADPCSAAVGRTFRTLEELECGRGGSRCRWRLVLDADAVRWRWSDTSVALKYSCRNAFLTPTPRTPGDDLPPKRVAVGPAGAWLDWNGRRYYAEGMEPSSADASGAETPQPSSTPPPSGAPVAPKAPSPTPGDAIPSDPLGLLTPPAPSPTPLKDALSGPSISKLGTDEEARSCSSAADCRVSTRIDGSCCPHGCGPASAYNTGYLARLEAHQKEACKGTPAQCPAWGCASTSYRAACVDGSCQAISEGF